MTNEAELAAEIGRHAEAMLDTIKEGVADGSIGEGAGVALVAGLMGLMKAASEMLALSADQTGKALAAAAQNGKTADDNLAALVRLAGEKRADPIRVRPPSVN